MLPIRIPGSHLVCVVVFLLLSASPALAEVRYAVFPAAMNPTCDEQLMAPMPKQQAHILTISQTGACQDLGQGRSAYNSIEILGCSKRCLCFKQYASPAPNPTCNQTLARVRLVIGSRRWRNVECTSHPFIIPPMDIGLLSLVGIYNYKRKAYMLHFVML